jgi:hypothetical protein
VQVRALCPKSGTPPKGAYNFFLPFHALPPLHLRSFLALNSVWLFDCRTTLRSTMRFATATIIFLLVFGCLIAVSTRTTPENYNNNDSAFFRKKRKIQQV